MLITMFTDISLCSQTGCGAFAVWAKESGEAYRVARLFKEPVSDSNIAEAQAIVSGTLLVILHYKAAPGSRIIAQTDSVTAIKILDGTHAKFTEIRAIQSRMLSKHGVEIEYRHVQGHRGTMSRRNAVNTWCDRACRKVLADYRRTIA